MAAVKLLLIWTGGMIVNFGIMRMMACVVTHGGRGLDNEVRETTATGVWLWVAGCMVIVVLHYCGVHVWPGY